MVRLEKIDVQFAKFWLPNSLRSFRNQNPSQKMAAPLFGLPTRHPFLGKETGVERIEKRILKVPAERGKSVMAFYCLQRAVWHNGGCVSLDSATKQ